MVCELWITIQEAKGASDVLALCDDEEVAMLLEQAQRQIRSYTTCLDRQICNPCAIASSCCGATNILHHGRTDYKLSDICCKNPSFIKYSAWGKCVCTKFVGTIDLNIETPVGGEGYAWKVEFDSTYDGVDYQEGDLIYLDCYGKINTTDKLGKEVCFLPSDIKRALIRTSERLKTALDSSGAVSSDDCCIKLTVGNFSIDTTNCQGESADSSIIDSGSQLLLDPYRLWCLSNYTPNPY